ncbi:MAG: tetratricopeptide repeat protein [Bacteroidetes bacterium]|nr:MAG: tetratricopeptide repeat protein [Bacteroidota bacterium]REK06448.1 MAG: tetratricopeptide repeat protein [Bacteroidota bacterium]REK33214.1 MAG: tetratricopeptide repeat protein [Bacteroidota bacterium]REK47051.1 MAG: tetratricopeptide repeat protein [Bacteroidota bacterium]
MAFGRLLFIFFFLISADVHAYYLFNEKVRNAYKEIISLRLDHGALLLEDVKRQQPGNTIVFLYENYIDFLKAFISEDEGQFKAFKKNSALRLKQLERHGTESASPFHLYAISEILLQEAMLKLKFKEYITGANDIRKSYKLIERNKAVYPTFLLNKKLSGFIHTLVGAVPKDYRWLVDMVGMKGTIPLGTEELKSLYVLLGNSEFEVYREEVLFYLSNIHNSFAKNEAHAHELLGWMESYASDNTLIRYCYANVVMKMGRNDDAFRILSSKSNSAGVFPFYYLDYKLGLSRLRKLDLTADGDIKKFIKAFPGMNYRKAAYQKLAWIDFLKGDSVGYRKNMNTILSVGVSNVDEDKEAHTEASTGEYPNPILLRSRLLFDGGYYMQSWNEITSAKVKAFPLFRDQLELTYRLGRIMHKLKFTEKAIHYYSQTLRNGEKARYYFAANSSLLIGNIHEDEGAFDLARKYYEKCLSIRGHDYQNSIDQKAQAGIDRLNAMTSK